MNGVTGTCFKRGFPRLPWVLRSPRRTAAMHKRIADAQRKHEIEEAQRRAMSVAPVTASV
jgi:hypothetical protein